MKRIVISMIIIPGMVAIAIILLNADSDEAIESMTENELRQFEQNPEGGLMIEIGN